ncbi:MAG: PKD domain-containing protein [Bacteroidales bacterium]|nr:PKD domain-containing protein [Bacteroidales bacterium]
MKTTGKYILILVFAAITNFSPAQSFKIAVLPLSAEYNKYAPAVYKGEFLVFCSDRKNELIKLITDTSGKYLSDLYQIKLKDSINKTIKLFSRNITTPFNEGPVCFSPDFTTIYFTRNLHLFTRPKDIENKENNLGIFTATATDTGWANIQPFLYNSDNYNIAHPALSSDGEILIFASDMQGGYGGSDLYYCKKQGKGWSKPKNLGSKINSSGNEFFPFLHPSGRLYFASDRKNGLGGLDIYYTDKTKNRWKEPLPLDTPFNSTADDFGVYVDSSFESGYFSSNRNGTDDIFRFVYRFPSFDNCDSLQNPVLCYDLYEEHALDNDSMPLEYEWNFGDGTKTRGGEVNHCFPKPGHYTIKLNVINTVTNEISYNDAIYDLDIADFIQPKIHAADTVSVNHSVIFTGSCEKFPNLTNVRYFWSFGNEQKGKGQEIIHQYSSVGNYKIKLVITGIDKQNNKKQYGVFKWIVVY